MLYCLLLFLAGCTHKKSLIKDDSFAIPKFKPRPPIRKRAKYPDGWLQKISVNIAKNMSVKDVLSQISSSTSININLEGIEDITGISYAASNMPFLRALKSICRLCGWRIKINSIGDISLLKDENYFHTHEVAFLLHLRKMKLSTKINTIGKVTDSNITQLYSENELNLWDEIEQNLKFLLRDDKNRYALNKQGGLIIINATQAEHEEIARFLRQLYVRVASQVFIEGKIIEVTLYDPHSNGIKWNLASTISNSPGNSTAIIQDIVQGIDFLKTFGETKILSNPCTFVLNNQFAIFQSVINKPTFKLMVNNFAQPNQKYNKNQTPIANNIVTTSEMNVIPIGITFIVQPSIDFRNRSVTLCLKPTMSSLDETANIQDPAALALQINNAPPIPVVDEKSIDTVINVRDGETVIMGGLIRKDETPAQIGLQKGKFSARSHGKLVKEMVMLIKVNIVEPERNNFLSMSECEILDLEQP